MTDNTNTFETLIERAEEYGKSTIELAKLKIVDKSADTLSSLVSQLVFLMVIVLSVLITSIGLSLWIGKELGEPFYGFLIVGFFYSLIAILLRIFQNQLIKYPISNSLIKQMLKKKHYEK